MKQHNKQARLAGRRADWTNSLANKDPLAQGKEKRKTSGGFKRPGSNSK